MRTTATPNPYSIQLTASRSLSLGPAGAKITTTMRSVTAAAALTLLVGCDSAQKHYDLGAKQEFHNNLDSAELQFKLALRDRPDFPEAHMELGKVYIDRGILDAALDHTKKAIEIFKQKKATTSKIETWQQLLSKSYNNAGVIFLQQSNQGSSSWRRQHCRY